MHATIFLKSDGANAAPVRTSEIDLQAPSVVHLDLAPEDVARFDRQGNDLKLVLKSGQTLVIRNFFVVTAEGTNDLVLEDDAGTVWMAQYDAQGAVTFSVADPVAAPVWFPVWTQAAFGAGLLAVLGICAANTGKDPFPTINITDDKSPKEGLKDGVISSLDTREAVVISGTWTPGGQVTQIVISDADGDPSNDVVIPQEAITVNPDGTYSVTADLSGLKDGPLTVTGTFVTPKGDKTHVIDSTIMQDTVTTVAIDPVVIDEGVLTVITGTAEPGATVTLSYVTIVNGEEVTVTFPSFTVDASGVWSQNVSGVDTLTETVTFTAHAVDKYGNEAEAARDLGGLYVTGLENSPSAGLTLAESDLKIMSPANDGKAAVSAEMQLLAPGNELKSVTFGNNGPTYTLDDLLAATPDAPLEIATKYGTLIITGYDQEAGRISYAYAISQAYEHKNNEPLAESLKITVVEADGDIRKQTLTLTLTDDTPTAEDGDPRELIEGDGQTLTGDLLDGSTGVDGASVNKIYYTDKTGKPAEALLDGKEVTVTTLIGTLTVAPDGTWSYTARPVDEHPTAIGQQADDFNFVLIDKDGSISNKAIQPITFIDTKTTVAIDPVVIDEGVLTVITGTAEPGATVTLSYVTIVDGKEVTVTFPSFTVDASGEWSQDVSGVDTLTETVTFTAHAVDKYGNEAEAARDLGGLYVTGLENLPSSGLTLAESDLKNMSPANDGKAAVSAEMQLLAPGNELKSVTFGNNGPTYTLDDLLAATPDAPLEIATKYGTLIITGYDQDAGTISYAYAISQAYKHTNNEPLEESFKITVVEADGDIRKQTLTLTLTDDAPTAEDGERRVLTEGDGKTLTGDLLVGSTGVDGASVNKIYYTDNTGNPAEAVLKGKEVTVTTLLGTLTVAPDGKWSYTARPVIDHPAGADRQADDFRFDLIDADGSISNTATQPIIVLDTVPTVGTSTEGFVSERHLPDGLQPDATQLTTTGTLGVQGGVDSFKAKFDIPTAESPLSKLTSGGVAVVIDVSEDGQTLIGRNKDTGAPVFTVVLTDSDTNKAGYIFTLHQELDHGTDETLPLTFPFTVTDNDDDTAKGGFTVTIFDAEDKAPVKLEGPEDNKGKSTTVTGASPETVKIVQGEQTLVSKVSGGVLEAKTAHGTVLVDASGKVTYIPDPDFSGSETFSVFINDPKTNDYRTTVIEAVTTPVTDKPAIAGGKAETLEDTAVALGLKAPATTDKDGSERLGLITLTGLPDGATITDKDGNTILSGTGSVKIILTDSGLSIPYADMPANVVRLTVAEYEALVVSPPKDRHENMTLQVSVEAHEVDKDGVPLSGIASATSNATVQISVKAVTDEIALAFDAEDEIVKYLKGFSSDRSADNYLELISYDAAGKDLSLKLNEDTTVNISPFLAPTIENDANREGDASEKRWITVNNPTNVAIFVNGKRVAAGATSKEIYLNEDNTLPNIIIRAPRNFSGTLSGITVTLHAQDVDGDGFTLGAETGAKGYEAEIVTDKVTLDLSFRPTLDFPEDVQANLKEDTAGKFLSKLVPRDRSTKPEAGGEEVITSLSFIPPAGWTVMPLETTEDPDVLNAASFTYAADTGYTITFAPEASQADRTAYLDLWTILPPAHSSKDEQIVVKVGGQDTSTIAEKGKDPITDIITGSKDVTLTLKVTPVAEVIVDKDTATDTDNGRKPDLTMTPGYSYGSSFVNEDQWFKLNTDAFKLADGWSNEDGGDTTGRAEVTKAIFELVTKNGEKLPAGSFRYIGDDGKFVTVEGTTKIVVDVKYLPTLEFKPAPNFSGVLEIKVQAQTTDKGDDTDDTAVTATSGEAWLTDILVLPKIDVVTVAVDGAEVGEEDTPISLSIRPRSDDMSDKSENFTVTIEGIPAGAVLTYTNPKNPKDVLTFTDKGTGQPFNATIPNFDQNYELQVLPPKDSNDDFELTVKTMVEDSVTITNEVKTNTSLHEITLDQSAVMPSAERTVTFTDIPAGVTVYYAGRKQENGVAFTTSDLNAPVIISRPKGGTADFTLTVTTETTNGSDPVVTELPVTGGANVADIIGLPSDPAPKNLVVTVGVPGAVLVYGDEEHLIPTDEPMVIGDFDPTKPLSIKRPEGSEEAFDVQLTIFAADIKPVTTVIAVPALRSPINLNVPPVETDDDSVTEPVKQDVTLSSLPVGVVVYYGGVEQEAGEDGNIVIKGYDSAKGLTVTTTSDFSGTAVITFESSAKSVSGKITVTVEGDITTTKTEATYRDAIGPVELPELTIDVQVKGVPDPATIETIEGKTYTEASLDNKTASVKLSDLIKGVTLSDIDGSETASIEISDLPEGFELVGAVLLPERDGKQVWLVPATAEAFANVTVKVPANLSGEVTFKATPQTTENDGAKTLWKENTKDVSFIVTASPEADVTDKATIEESSETRNKAQLINLGVVARNNDLDETLEYVGIPVGYANGKAFDLYIIDRATGGQRELSEAGLPVETVNGKAYYILDAANVGNLAALGDKHAKGDLGGFDFIYKIGDAPAVAHSDGTRPKVVSEWQDKTFTLTAVDVTDPVTVALGDLTSDDPKVTLTEGETPLVTVAGDSSFTLYFDVATVDFNDQSPERVSRLVLEGIPEGTAVQNAQYTGDGTWIIVLEGQYSLSYQKGKAYVPVTFIVSDASATVSDVKVTAHSVDKNNVDVVQGETLWRLDTTYREMGEGKGESLIEDWAVKTASITEDTGTVLADIFTGTMKESGNSDFYLTLSLEGLPEGSTVESVDGKYTMVQTTVEGVIVWTISFTVPRGKSAEDVQAMLDEMLNGLAVKPPQDVNSLQNGGENFTFTGKLSSYQISTGYGDFRDALSENPILPLSDKIDITIESAQTLIGERANEFAFSVTLKNESDNSFGKIVGETLYISLSGVTEGVLLIGDETTGYKEYALTELTEASAQEAFGGATKAFQIPVSEMGKLDFIYKAPEGTTFTVGDLIVTAHVVGQEIGDTLSSTVEEPNSKSQTVVIAADHDHVTSRMDLDAKIIGMEAQTSSKANIIELKPAFTLNDADSEIASLILISGVPEGFLVYVGNSKDDVKLAASAGDGSWMLSTEGTIPAYVGILPPRYWSGVVDTLELVVTSGEVEMTDEARALLGSSVTDRLPMPHVEITPVLSGFIMKPTDAFGLAGEEIPLNFNAALKDWVDLKGAGENIDYAETVTLTLKGLGEFAKFIADGVALDSSVVEYKGDGTYALKNLTQSQINTLHLVQSDKAGVSTVTVTAVVHDGAISAPLVNKTTGEEVSIEFKVQIMENTRDLKLDNDLAWTGSLLNGGEGFDTVHARFDTITGTDLAKVLSNIEVLDLQIAGSNTITDLRPSDVAAITDDKNRLTILGSKEDRVTLSGDWADNGDNTFTGTHNGKQVTLLLGEGSTVEVVMPASPLAPVMSSFAFFDLAADDLLSDASGEDLLASLPPEAPAAIGSEDIGAASDYIALDAPINMWSELDELKLDEV